MRFVVLAAAAVVAVMVWRSRHGAAVWHDGETLPPLPNEGP